MSKAWQDVISSFPPPAPEGWTCAARDVASSKTHVVLRGHGLVLDMRWRSGGTLSASLSRDDGDPVRDEDIKRVATTFFADTTYHVHPLAGLVYFSVRE